jgi:predicted MFS family arabinose efflux permease
LIQGAAPVAAVVGLFWGWSFTAWPTIGCGFASQAACRRQLEQFDDVVD